MVLEFIATFLPIRKSNKQPFTALDDAQPTGPPQPGPIIPFGGHYFYLKQNFRCLKEAMT